MGRIYIPKPYMDHIIGSPDFRGRKAAPEAEIVTDSLVGWWPHDEGAGAVLGDSSGNGHNGIIQGAGFWGNTAPDGTPVGTYTTGTPNWISGLGFGMGITGAITIMAAVRYPGYGYYDVIQKRRGTGGTQRCNYALRLENSDEFSFLFTEADTATWHYYFSSNFNVAVNTWYIMAFVYTFGTAASAKFYKNNSPVNGSWAGGTGAVVYLSAQMTYVIVGAHDESNPGDGVADNHFATMRMGDLLLYSKQLSVAEMTVNYDFLKGKYGLP